MGTSRSRSIRRRLKRSWDRPAGEHNQRTPILKLPAEISQRILRYTFTEEDMIFDLASPFFLFRRAEQLRSVCWKWYTEMLWVKHKWMQDRDELIKNAGTKYIRGPKFQRWLNLQQLVKSDQGVHYESRFAKHQLSLARQKLAQKAKQKRRRVRLAMILQARRDQLANERLRRLQCKWRRGLNKHYKAMVKQTIQHMEKFGIIDRRGPAQFVYGGVQQPQSASAPVVWNTRGRA